MSVPVALEFVSPDPGDCITKALSAGPCWTCRAMLAYTGPVAHGRLSLSVGGARYLVKISRRTVLWGHRCRHDGIDVVHQSILAQQLRPPCRVSFLVSSAEILPDEASMAIGKVAMVNLLGVVWTVLVQ